MVNSGFTLIRSKLLVPSPAGLLHRPRVCQAIEQGLECKLTLVSAPAGYGKTSALVDFAQHNSVPICWYTADERDRDLGTFIEYLVGAVAERFPDFGERTRAELASLGGDLFRDPTAVVGELVNEMLEIDASFGLVVDNYEALDGALAVRPFVHRLLEVLPSNCHLMLGGRVLPDVPVTQLVAKRQLVGLAAQDLRFEAREIRDLLALSGIEVSESRARAMAASSEGWVTGVVLLADLLRDDAEAALVEGGRATGQTYDYMAKEVLSRQPPHVREFLHTSAVLREMSSELCEEVLEISRPRALLAEVERRRLFVTRFGGGPAATYRYHNLFRDFLDEQLHQRDAVRYAELHRRAAKRFEGQDEIEEAVYHYLAAEAHSEATALMERVAMEWFSRGRGETLLRWAEELPEEVRDRAPRVSLYQSKVLTDRYDYERARQALAYAEAGFAHRGDVTRLARVHNQRALLGLFEGRHEDVLREAETALGMLGQDEAAGRAQAERLIGRAYVELGRVGEGVAKLEEALAWYREFGSPYNVANLLQDLILALAAQGRFDEAAACTNEALAIGRRLGAPAQLAGVLNSLGWVHCVRGEYREALALYEEGLAATRRGGDLRGQANISEGMASVYAAIGAYERAEYFYNAAWQIARESRPGLEILVLAARVDVYRWQGDYTRALGLLKQADQLAEEQGLDFEKRGLLSMAEGITLAETGETERGLRLLFDAVGFLAQRGAKRELARARFLLAKAHLLADDEPQAAAELRRAMNLADEIGTDQFAVVEGQHAEELVKLGVAEGVAGCRTIPEKVEQLKAFGEELVQVGAEEGAVSRLEVYALGEGRVVRDGGPVPSSEWRAAMAKELFFYILLNGPQEREAMGLVFWADLSTERLADNFHTTLYRVRRALGGEAVVLEGGKYRLGDVDYWFDVEEFEALTERARLLPPGDWQAEHLWRRAVGLYGGDLLPEVERVWCLPKREALRGMYIEALVGVGRCLERRGEFEGAIGWYRRALGTDELREEVHRSIMRCYAEARRRSEALAQYRRCEKILRRELDIEPSIETTKLYEEIAGRGPG